MLVDPNAGIVSPHNTRDARADCSSLATWPIGSKGVLTYNTPRPKTVVSSIFRLIGICKSQINGIGMTNMAESETMLTPQSVSRRIVLLKQ